ncbi:MAG: hypothetical protein ABFD08_02290 [Syntrophomonas sp.]
MNLHNSCEESSPYFRIWLIFLIYTAFIAALIQLVVLPHFFPAWHAGNGLLVGGDWLQFHKSAVQLAAQIKIQGWSAWQLRPDGQAPIGIASAIYAITTPQPWTLIPLNAALHATSGLVLLRLIQIFIPSWKKAIWCVLPFMLFPSAMTWYTQIHKDGLFILGILFFIWGFLALGMTWHNNKWAYISSFVYVILGSVLVWIVRPYGVQMLQVIGLLLGLLLTVYSLIAVYNKVSKVTNLLKPLFFFILILFLTPLAKGGIRDVAPPSSSPTQSPIIQYQSNQWKTSTILPAKIDVKFYTLASVRDSYFSSYPHATSNIDLDVRFHSAQDIFLYVPRAFEIALFSPFPVQWFDIGSSDSNTIMRRVSALEMIITYIFLAFLVYALHLWSKRFEVWALVVFCSAMMLGFSVVIPNIGSLYRTRYGFMMILVALGIAGFIKLIENRWGKFVKD